MIADDPRAAALGEMLRLTAGIEPVTADSGGRPQEVHAAALETGAIPIVGTADARSRLATQRLLEQAASSPSSSRFSSPC